MKVLIDTNVIISAILNSRGAPAQAFAKAVAPPFQPYISIQTIQELIRIFQIKFPNKIIELNTFLEIFLINITIIPHTSNQYDIESCIRDINDRPILRAALYSHSDYILTGDKDFLEANITQPIILSPSDFLMLRQ